MTQEARASNYTRAQAFLDAGAHILSTDFPVLPTFFNSTYAVRNSSGPTQQLCCLQVQQKLATLDWPASLCWHSISIG